MGGKWREQLAGSGGRKGRNDHPKRNVNSATDGAAAGGNGTIYLGICKGAK